MPSVKNFEYLILDFETTGLSAAESEIIEIGALAVQGLTPLAQLNCLVKPKKEVPKAISQLTGITPEMLEDQLPLEDVLSRFLEFVGNRPIVAHNCSMEESFITEHIAPHAPTHSFEFFNSIEPLALIFPDSPSHSMESLRKLCKVDSDNSHRAFKDCEDLLKILTYSRDVLFNDRGQIQTIVEKTLGKDWWWSWLFGLPNETTYEPKSLLDAIKRHPLGDFVQKATKKEKINDNLVTEALHGKNIISTRSFEYRKAQEEMTQAVKTALIEEERIAIEAPTGTGKSVAYLIPSVLAAVSSDTPVVVSTHSKSLQDQLLKKDVPVTTELLGLDKLKATTVKGQENYVCLRKLYELASTITDDTSYDEKFCLAYLLALSSVSDTAETDTVSNYLKQNFPSFNEIISNVSSHFTTTKGQSCRFYDHCHFFNSARLAHSSQIIIANHALVFRWPNHLPDIRNIIFDEAHHLEDQITDAFSIEVEEETVAENLNRLSRKHGKRRVGDCTQLAMLIRQLKLSARFTDKDPSKYIEELTETAKNRLLQLTSLIPLVLPKNRQGTEGYEEPIHLNAKPALSTLVDTLSNLGASLADIADYLKAAIDACEGSSIKNDLTFDILLGHAARFDEFQKQLKIMTDFSDCNYLRIIYWHPREYIWRASAQPIEVAKLAAEFWKERRTIVLTSATLSGGKTSCFLTDRIGLELSKPLLSLPSPYNLKELATVFIPHDIGPPGTQGHLDALIGFTEQMATLLKGKTMLLISSNRRLRIAAETLRERLTKRGIEVFDSVSDRRAIDIFKTSKNALLIGSEKYGEGIDIPGQRLSCVIIEKINEAMTRTPIAEARKLKTKFPLYDYDFPLRMQWLKQRAGRLIRSPTDTGVVVIFDPRYNNWTQASRDFVNRTLAPIPIQTGSRDQILINVENTLAVNLVLNQMRE